MGYCPNCHQDPSRCKCDEPVAEPNWITLQVSGTVRVLASDWTGLSPSGKIARNWLANAVRKRIIDDATRLSGIDASGLEVHA